MYGCPYGEMFLIVNNHMNGGFLRGSHGIDNLLFDVRLLMLRCLVFLKATMNFFPPCQLVPDRLCEPPDEPFSTKPQDTPASQGGKWKYEKIISCRIQCRVAGVTCVELPNILLHMNIIYIWHMDFFLTQSPLLCGGKPQNTLLNFQTYSKNIYKMYFMRYFREGYN